MHAYFVVGLIFFATLMAGCESNTIFSANFNADTVGNPPSEFPPGSPSGDRIYLPAAFDASSSYASPALVVSAPGFTTNALRYSNINIPFIWWYLGFIGDDVDPTATGFFASWSGRLNLANNSSALDIWFGDSHFGEIASLRFDNGRVYLKTSLSPAAYEDLGAYTNDDTHSVLINIDKDDATYGISFLQSSIADINTGSRSALSPASLDTANPTIYFWFSQEGVSSSGYYTVDDVVISEILPDSATRVAGQLPGKAL